MDIISLFPSIPQKECLQITYEEMCIHQDLLIFSPNLLIHLLQYNMQNNYFEFADFCLFQKTGVTMGAAFSPTVANIFVSVFLRKFLNTINEQPILIARYVDDIFLIWPKKFNIDIFTSKINKFHPNIRFTTITSDTSIDFLDITIFKGNLYTKHQLLDIKTFQKPHNLYQYLNFSSNHTKSTFKSLITGECVRYVRTNTDEQNYLNQISLFKLRLQRRSYPTKFINNNTKKIKYSDRNKFLREKSKHKFTQSKPIFKCLPPPKYTHLKQIILNNYDTISKIVNHPVFITLRYKTLQNSLVKSKFKPTNENIIDIYLSCTSHIDQDDNTPPSPSPEQSTTWNHVTPPIQPCICNHPKCATCQHFNTQNFFESTTTKARYRIRQSFTCSSKNVIYLITCNKCKKQYVGQTTKSLKERINHHRSSIHTKQKRYISVHFNFPDHNLKNLTVQIIDTTTSEKLSLLEKFWIKKLQTTRPNGLNNTTD